MYPKGGVLLLRSFMARQIPLQKPFKLYFSLNRGVFQLKYLEVHEKIQIPFGYASLKSLDTFPRLKYGYVLSLDFLKTQNDSTSFDRKVSLRAFWWTTCFRASVKAKTPKHGFSETCLSCCCCCCRCFILIIIVFSFFGQLQIEEGHQLNRYHIFHILSREYGYVPHLATLNQIILNMSYIFSSSFLYLLNHHLGWPLLRSLLLLPIFFRWSQRHQKRNTHRCRWHEWLCPPLNIWSLVREKPWKINGWNLQLSPMKRKEHDLNQTSMRTWSSR